MNTWSPYLVGLGIGVISCLTFLLSDKSLGVSSGFVRLTGLLEKLVRGSKIEEKIYYQENPPAVDWSLLFVVGLGLGSLIAAKLAGGVQLVLVPQLWREQWGPTLFLRWTAALIGGVLIGFGARWAGGCTSGHGISGTLKLAVISWLTFIFFFIGGAAAAFVLYS